MREPINEFTDYSPQETLVWSAADLSASTSTNWALRPAWARAAFVRYTWTNTDTPSGTFNVEVDDVCTDGVAGDVFSPAPTHNPTGAGAGSHVVELDTAAAGIRLTYTATSGGTGAIATATVTWGA
jgi:hypothetical protein